MGNSGCGNPSYSIESRKFSTQLRQSLFDEIAHLRDRIDLPGCHNKIGDLIPLAHVNGLWGLSLIALICNNFSHNN
ncbi:MAG: hypothetical protein IPK46_22295 [Saprospiraceae bacterium]|nr:hypothetical protein [Saprospiraceae bacterium]